jgi:hypothetical protein
VSPTILGWAFLQIGPEGVGRFVEGYQGEELWFALCEHCDRYHLMTNAARVEQERRREEQRQEAEAMIARLEEEAAKGPSGIFNLPFVGGLLRAMLGRPQQPAIAGPTAESSSQLPAADADVAAEPAAVSHDEQPPSGGAPNDG